MTYSDAGVFADFAAPRSVTIALVPANAAGNKTADMPVAEANILLGALDSASILPQQVSSIADGVDRPIAVDINSARDNYGNTVTDGTRIAITSTAWYRRHDGGWNNGSPGGVVSGGVPTPNDGRFRTYTLIGGAAQATYSPGSLVQTQRHDRDRGAGGDDGESGRTRARTAGRSRKGRSCCRRLARRRLPRRRCRP